MAKVRLRKIEKKLLKNLAKEMVIMAGTIMLAYYFEYTDTFSVNVQGFFCYDTTYTKPYLGPEDSSAVPPVLLYALVAGLPTLLKCLPTGVTCLSSVVPDVWEQERSFISVHSFCGQVEDLSGH